MGSKIKENEIMNRKISHLSKVESLKQIGKFFLIAFGTIWLLIEFPSSVNSDLEIYVESLGNYVLVFSIILSLIYGVIRVFPKMSVKKEFKASNTSIEIKVSDIFNEKTHIAIGSSDYFDTNYDINSNLSLKSQVINKCFNSDVKYVDELIQISLTKQNLTGIEDENRIEGKKVKYPPGTTVILPHDSRKIFVVIISKLIYEGSRKHTSSNPQLLNNALNKLWETVKTEGRMKPLTIPVFGSGLASINLSFLLLTQLIVLSFVTYSKNTRITDKLTINIHESQYNPSDFEELKKFLDSMEI